MAEDVELNVYCPFDECTHSKEISIPSYVFENKSFGTVKIQIDMGAVCSDHQFVVYVDKKGIIRGYEKVDLQLVIPQTKEKVTQEKAISLSDFIRLMGDYSIKNIIRALVLNVPVIIFTQEVNLILSSRIQNLIKEMFADVLDITFRPEIINRVDYKNYDLKGKLVVDDQGLVISAPWQIDKYEFEGNLLQKSLTVENNETQILLFKQTLSGFMKMILHIRNFIGNNEYVFEKDLKKELAKKFALKKVSNYIIDNIKEILNFRYFINPSKIRIQSYDILKEGMW